jgi:hypothetical protein
MIYFVQFGWQMIVIVSEIIRFLSLIYTKMIHNNADN